MSAEGLETVVVVDVQGINSFQVNTIESAQKSVGNGNRVCSANGVGEGKGWEGWKSGPVDFSNSVENSELKSGQESQVAQKESLSDSGKGRT